MGLLNNVCGLLVYLMVMRFVSGNVVLMGTNVSRSFDDLEAEFTPKIQGSGENGVLYVAKPLNACSPLTNKVVDGPKHSFVLIIRGGCSFDDKVKSAQNAGFRAAIIYDFEDNAPLVAMGGTRHGIKIYAVFVSKASGKILQQYAGRADVELWVLPSYVGSPWSIMAVSFIALLAMSAALATCFFVHRHHGRRERPRVPQVPEFHGMSRRLVKAMPSLIFTTVLDENCTSRTCAICLEDYNTGEKLRILPCLHKFHAMCVDSWLTVWRTFCPVCKRDARVSVNIPSASESTPLLSSVPPSPSSTATLLSCHSSLAPSPSIPIVSTPPRYPTASHIHTLSNSHHMPNSFRSYNNSPCLRNVPSQRSQTSHLISPHSMGLPMSSSYSIRYMQPYNRSSSNASPGYLLGSSSNRLLMSSHSIGLPVLSPCGSRYMQPYDRGSSVASPSYLVGSSGKHSYLQHCESGASISRLASLHTLPSC